MVSTDNLSIRITAAEHYNSQERKCWILSQSNLKAAALTQQNLIDAFCYLLAKQPITKITITAIAKRAGYDRTTFYQYFDRLADLQQAAQQQFLNFIVAKRQSIHLDSPDFVDNLVAIYIQKPLYFEAFFGRYADNQFIDQIITDFSFDFLDTNLGDTDRTKSYLMVFHVTTILSLFRLWLSRDKDLSTTEFITLSKRLYTQGINTFK